MTWKFFETRDGDGKAQVLLDHRFAGAPPTAVLPNIAWFGVWCNEASQGAYWSPTEAPVLDAIEADLIRARRAAWERVGGVFAALRHAGAARVLLLLWRGRRHARSRRGVGGYAPELSDRVRRTTGSDVVRLHVVVAGRARRLIVVLCYHKNRNIVDSTVMAESSSRC